MRRLTKIDMSQIQTMVAGSLQMERGKLKVNSNRERLEPVEYKRQQEELKIQKLEKHVQLLEQKKNTVAKRNQTARDEYKRFKRRSEKIAITGIKLDWKSVKNEANALSEAIELQQSIANRQKQTNQAIKSEAGKLEREIQKVEHHSKLRKTVRRIDQKIEETRNKIIALENHKR